MILKMSRELLGSHQVSITADRERRLAAELLTDASYIAK